MKQIHRNNLWAYSSFAGAMCCAVALCVIGMLYVHSASRHELDRVSFRLMTWSLVSNTIFGITSGCVGFMTEPAWGCRFAVWIKSIQLTLHISTFLLFCIALNLHLVILHNVRGENLEKWYYIGSVLLALVLTIPPLVAKQYGWDDVVGTCWYANRGDVSERIRWQVATQLFWSMACALGELVVFVSVFTHMLRHHVRPFSLRLHRRSSLTMATAVARQRSSQHYTITHRGVIIRIALYPIASFILNSIIIACDLQSTVSSSLPHRATKATYGVRLLNDFCYGGRGIVYAILGITDPVSPRPLQYTY
ncbi:hypothetical protein CYLTODRAFT_356337 [Cylindrobasidium torrendii FP15055 ss-10]|uniref:G-protein coupled receptors family 2 profile 2 domain-containing protein n=1 Tax=Cylindrobasidium torrendii FP15055 ss-10 TaxID=1314674 RepID=A0A0D7B5H7_9AGAR|nr:hypothetical protein CYLTODRAFT_356337 [Cylindrobasidium torrendii FP15055 ss-10]